jgi:glutamate-1-semialdehyde 2,1-aminomutase
MSTTKSQQWFDRAKKIIPGGVNSPVRSFKHVGITPVYFERAQGAYLTDVDGNVYTDFCLAFGPHLLGHGPENVVRALHAQIDRATTFGACHPQEVELADSILKAYPFLDQVRLLSSGTEAVMTAVRLARGFTGRSKIVQFEGCYHGHSDGFLAKAGSGVAFLSESSSQGVPESVVNDTLVVRMDDLPALEKLFQLHGDKIAALVMEPIPANNGLWEPTREHLQFIVQLARKHGAVVIFDEVICGFRISLQGAAGYFDLQPDIVTLGKIVGGGLPMAAVVGRAAIMGHLAPAGPVYQAGTLSGNPMGCAAGGAVLRTLFADPPYAHLAKETKWFAGELEKSLGRSQPVTVRSVASLFWIHFGKVSEAFPPEISPASHEAYAGFFRRALAKGIYLPPSPYEVGFISTAHTRAVLEDALGQLAACVD